MYTALPSQYLQIGWVCQIQITIWWWDEQACLRICCYLCFGFNNLRSTMFSYIKGPTSFWPFHWNVQLKGKIPWFSFAILFALQSSPGLAQIPQICSLSKSVRFKPNVSKTFSKHGQTRFLIEMNFIWLKFPPFPQILAKVGEIVVWQWKPDFKKES